MKWISQYRHPESWGFEIEQQALRNITDRTEETAYYLNVYNEKGANTHDFMQDTLHWAKHQAFEEFGVPMDSWVEAR